MSSTGVSEAGTDCAMHGLLNRPWRQQTIANPAWRGEIHENRRKRTEPTIQDHTVLVGGRAPEDASDQALPEAVDVAIVGSGYTGLCCALELADAGGKPLILEAGPLGAGASTRSGAMVTGGQKFVVSGAIRHLDAGRQAGVLEDAGESLQLIGERVKRYNLDADYRRYGRVILAHVPRI